MAEYSALDRSSSADAEQQGLIATADAAAAAPSRPRGLGSRHAMAAALFCGAAVCYAQRVGLPIAIVRMQPIFGYDRAEQGGLMSIFYLGYMLLQIPGALLAQRFGARRSVGAAILGSSVLSALVPLAARTGVTLVYAVRFGQGLCQGCLFPSIATLWSRWAPPSERSRLASFPQVGGFVGTLVFEALGGWQCDHRYEEPPTEGEGGSLSNALLWVFGGWEGVFVLHGCMGIAWLLLVWRNVGYDSPEQHPRITMAEAAYLRAACDSNSDIDRGGGSSSNSLHLPPSAGGGETVVLPSIIVAGGKEGGAAAAAAAAVGDSVAAPGGGSRPTLSLCVDFTACRQL